MQLSVAPREPAHKLPNIWALKHFRSEDLEELQQQPFKFSHPATIMGHVYRNCSPFVLQKEVAIRSELSGPKLSIALRVMKAPDFEGEEMYGIEKRKEHNVSGSAASILNCY